MATGNLLNLEKTSKMSPIKDEFLASYSKQILDNSGKNLTKNSAIKLSIEGSILLVFVNPPQIFSEGLVVAINKDQSSSET